MNNSIVPEDTEIILRKMCQWIKVPFESVDFSEPRWFSKHSWTQEREASFAVWLAAFLRKKKYVKFKTYRGQDAALYMAWKILFNYGWKTEDVGKLA